MLPKTARLRLGDVRLPDFRLPTDLREPHSSGNQTRSFAGFCNAVERLFVNASASIPSCGANNWPLWVREPLEG